METKNDKAKETMVLKIHDLAKEATRISRFIGETFKATFLGEKMTFHRCIFVKVNANEKKIDVPSDEDIKLKKRLEVLEVFDKIDDVIADVNSEFVDIIGNIVILERSGKFVEIEIRGRRVTPVLFPDDVKVHFKNPLERDIGYLVEKYPDLYHSFVKNLKFYVLSTILNNNMSRYNLGRIIQYIKKIEKEDVLLKENSI